MLSTNTSLGNQRTLVVCADDFAYSPAISEAIVDLAERGRISAISCMTASPLWPEHAKLLHPLRGLIDIGLHLVLIEDKPLTKMPVLAPNGRLPSLGGLWLDGVKMRTSRDGVAQSEACKELAAEIAAQYDAFKAAMGMAPMHLDGHRHAHIFPGVRPLVLKAAARSIPRAYVRNVAEPVKRVFRRGVAVPKALFLSLLGAGFGAAAQSAGISSSDGFGGVYSLRADEDIPALFARFLANTTPQHILMCHPGKDDGSPLGATRAKEYAFLASDAYPELLARHDLKVGRFSETPVWRRSSDRTRRLADTASRSVE